MLHEANAVPVLRCVWLRVQVFTSDYFKVGEHTYSGGVKVKVVRAVDTDFRKGRLPLFMVHYTFIPCNSQYGFPYLVVGTITHGVQSSCVMPFCCHARHPCCHVVCR